MHYIDFRVEIVGACYYTALSDGLSVCISMDITNIIHMETTNGKVNLRYIRLRILCNM